MIKRKSRKINRTMCSRLDTPDGLSAGFDFQVYSTDGSEARGRAATRRVWQPLALRALLLRGQGLWFSTRVS